MLSSYLSPAWFDEARRIVQEPRLFDLLEGKRLSGRLLNAGCGEGLYAPFIEQFDRVRVICNMDLARPSVSRRRADPRHRDSQGSLTALPFGAGSFDVVMCSEVLEHVEDEATAVAELARVLTPGGLLLLSVPTPPAPFDPAHVREGYTLEELTRVLAAGGFEILGSRWCMHAWMRGLYRAWQWQHRAAGRNLFPRVLLRTAAQLDLRTGWGRPWDLVVLAERRGKSQKSEVRR